MFIHAHTHAALQNFRTLLSPGQPLSNMLLWPLYTVSGSGLMGRVLVCQRVAGSNPTLTSPYPSMAEGTWNIPTHAHAPTHTHTSLSLSHTHTHTHVESDSPLLHTHTDLSLSLSLPPCVCACVRQHCVCVCINRKHTNSIFSAGMQSSYYYSSTFFHSPRPMGFAIHSYAGFESSQRSR